MYQFDAQDAPGGRPNYWGYQPVSFFAPHAGVQQPSRRPGRRRRVPRPRQGAPPGGPRGHPRRRLQPHGRGRQRRADLRLPRPGQRRVLPGRPRRPVALRGLQRHRQHAQRQRAGRAPPDPRQPPLLGRRDARRRLPVRPGLGALAGRGRHPGPAAADHLGHRDRPGPRRHQAHRRGVGRGRPVPGGVVRRRSLDRVERPLPRRRARVREERSGQGVGGRAAPAGLARTSTPTSGASPRRRSTSSPATTGSRSTTSSRTTASTTRRTARTTATATTRT